ncbi:hypothetical protein QWY90_07455 [Flavobacterium paronense]|nr:hypothetical protein [Flavobacterium paronense]MDN3677147.1 hypothetical protein [Flavobacterium paronense]
MIVLILCFFLDATAQNNTIVHFEELKQSILNENINLDTIDLSSEVINKTEIKILQLLNNTADDLNGKSFAFVSGSTGTFISKKTVFFNYFKDSFLTKNDVLSYSIIKLNPDQIKLSNTDYIVFFWTKTYNANSKALLKKIKNTKPQ